MKITKIEFKQVEKDLREDLELCKSFMKVLGCEEAKYTTINGIDIEFNINSNIQILLNNENLKSFKKFDYIRIKEINNNIIVFESKTYPCELYINAMQECKEFIIANNIEQCDFEFKNYLFNIEQNTNIDDKIKEYALYIDNKQMHDDDMRQDALDFDKDIEEIEEEQ